LALCGAVWLAGCATTPEPVQPVEELETGVVAEPPSTPMVEYPPVEPVEVIETPAVPTPAPAQAAVPPPAAEPSPAPAPVAPPPARVAPPEVPTDEQQVAALVADLQRFSGMGADDVRRELAAATQALSRQRTDANRVRLAVLYTLLRTAQDDQRALQLFDNVAKSNPGSPAVKQLAAVLQAQVAERARAVRDERQKADAAIQKLEALREMERALLRDRVRSGGGGDGGGGGGGGGSGR
jgi:hypothetical protein